MTAFTRFLGATTIALWCLIGFQPVVSAAEVNGVRFEEKVEITGQELLLNGAGLRKRFVFKVYAMGLYLPARADNSTTALAANGRARRVQIVTLRELTAEQLADALVEGLNKNLSTTEKQKLSGAIETFRSTMLSLGKAPEKTNISLDFVPGAGTRLIVNSERKGQDIPGEDFYIALLKIWLGKDPVQEDLRDQLLGVSTP
jgi:hypothetical protein